MLWVSRWNHWINVIFLHGDPLLKNVINEVTVTWKYGFKVIYGGSVMFIVTLVFRITQFLASCFYFRALFNSTCLKVLKWKVTLAKWANTLTEVTLLTFYFFYRRIKMIKRVNHIFKSLAAWKDWKHSISKKAFLCLQTKYCSTLAEKTLNVWNLFNINNRITWLQSDSGQFGKLAD